MIALAFIGMGLEFASIIIRKIAKKETKLTKGLKISGDIIFLIGFISIIFFMVK